jgi:phage gp46-like protein
MTDLALNWDPGNQRADMAVAGGDLAVDEGLRTAVIISLLTDRRAPSDAVPPDGSGDRRGWWGDLPFDAPDAPPAGDQIGSLLWLLSREKQIPETARRAEGYAREALQWMIDDGVASAVDALATFPRLGWMQLLVTIWRGDASETFDVMWRMS